VISTFLFLEIQISNLATGMDLFFFGLPGKYELMDMGYDLLLPRASEPIIHYPSIRLALLTTSVVEWSEFLATDPKARVQFLA
jgi:hypothetical protein